MRYHTRSAEPPEPRPRRSWPLVTAALFFAALSVILAVKWSGSNARAEQLQAELRQVYAEAESLRTRATHAEQRIGELERDLKASSAHRRTRDGPPATQPGTR